MNSASVKGCTEWQPQSETRVLLPVMVAASKLSGDLSVCSLHTGEHKLKRDA